MSTPVGRHPREGGDPQPAALRATWPAPPNVHAFTTLRHGAGASVAPFDTFNLGLRSGDDPQVVQGNRAALVEIFGLPGSPRWLRQVHGTTVAIEPGEDEPEADAAVTRTPGTVLAILTADCMPVVFAARDGMTLGTAHAGWRGLVAGVLEATVDAMQVPGEDLVAWLGPAASQRAYEIGEEVHDAFLSRDPSAASAFIATRPGHWRIDLYALARQRLADIGVTDVHGGDACTISEPQRFFSYRREPRSGRMATIAWFT